MFDLFKPEKQYSYAEATFRLGFLGCKEKQEFGLGLGDDPSGETLNMEGWVCLLTKRATVMAIRKYPDLDPQKITLDLVDIQYKK